MKRTSNSNRCHGNEDVALAKLRHYVRPGLTRKSAHELEMSSFSVETCTFPQARLLSGESQYVALLTLLADFGAVGPETDEVPLSAESILCNCWILNSPCSLLSGYIQIQFFRNLSFLSFFKSVQSCHSFDSLDAPYISIFEFNI